MKIDKDWGEEVEKFTVHRIWTIRMTQFTDSRFRKQWPKNKTTVFGCCFIPCLLPLLHLSGWFSLSVLCITLLLSVFASPQPGALSILLWQWNSDDEPCLQGAFPQGQTGANKYTSLTPFTHIKQTAQWLSLIRFYNIFFVFFQSGSLFAASFRSAADDSLVPWAEYKITITNKLKVIP